MPRYRFVRPETRTLPLSEDDWLVVRVRLTAGEKYRMFRAMYPVDDEGRAHVDSEQVIFAPLWTYLVDWSFTELPIRGAALDVVQAAVAALDEDEIEEVRTAMTAHRAAVAAERAAEKKTPTGATTSAPRSPSLVAVGGRTET